MAEERIENNKSVANIYTGHGSRRGLAVMVGAVTGWVIGAIFFVLTQNPSWLVIPPVIGIVLGYTVGYRYVSKK